jgi:alkylation response protein AidB-like acyl-CoA dehydrogenase
VDFRWSDEQNAIRELAREILEREVTPERVKQAEASADWIDEALWRTLAGANLLGVAIPAEHGGMGYGFAELCVLLEEIGRRVVPVPALATLALGALPLAEFGTRAQCEAWLPKVASGTAVLSAALVDAASADAAAPATRARPDGGAWILDGCKRCVPHARRADAILVPAATREGTAWFLLDPRAEGVELRGRVTSTGQPLFDVTLAGARVPDGARLAADGAALARWLEQRALVSVAALQMGVSARALEITAGYVREREQFGVPIGSFQAVQHRCADAFIDLEALRWTTWRAAWRLASGLPAAREARVAKFWAADAGSRIANASLHLHGGLGADVEHPIHRHFLWSRALELELGGASPQLARLGSDLARSGPGVRGSA